MSGVPGAGRATSHGADNYPKFGESCDIETHKVVTVGDCSVGKTSLILRMTKQFENWAARTTLGVDFFNWPVTVVDSVTHREQVVNLQLWDTAGEERFKDTLSNAYFRNTRAALFIFSQDDDDSLMYLDKWIEDALVYSPKDVKLFLCGNKKDKDVGNLEALHQQADFLAERYNIPKVFYTSALTGEGVAELEKELAKGVLGMEQLKRDGVVDITEEDEDDEIENPSSCPC